MELRAEDLRDELRPDVDGEKTLTLKISPGKRPEVSFTGTWTGKYIKAAMDSIARGYRVARRRVLTPAHQVETVQTQVKPEGGK